MTLNCPRYYGTGIGEIWVKGSSLNTVLTLPEPNWLFWNMLYHWAEHCKLCRFPASLADLAQHKKNAQTQVTFGTCIKVVRPFQPGSSRKCYVTVDGLTTCSSATLPWQTCTVACWYPVLPTLKHSCSARERCSTWSNWIPRSHSATL